MEKIQSSVEAAAAHLLSLRDSDLHRLHAEMATGPSSSAWLKASFPRTSALVPDAVAEDRDALVRCFSLAQLEDYEARLGTCARCPSTGGACAEETLIPRPGRQPRWNAARERPEAKRCDRWHPFLVRRGLEQSGVPARLLDARFENFEYATLAGQASRKKKALEAASRFADEIPKRHRGLFLFGPSESGKSHLAVATLARLVPMARVAISRPDPSAPWVRFAETSVLVRRMREQIGTDFENAVYAEHRDAAVVVLDDLGGVRLSDWATEELTMLLRERDSRGRPTIVTTKDPKKCERILGDFAPLFARSCDMVPL